MPVVKPRNRLVVFRLTQEEYEELKSVSFRRGARNISDFARSELLVSVARANGVDGAESSPPIGHALNDMQRGLDRLVQLVEQISQRFPNPAAAEESHEDTSRTDAGDSGRGSEPFGRPGLHGRECS